MLITLSFITIVVYHTIYNLAKEKFVSFSSCPCNAHSIATNRSKAHSEPLGKPKI
jgi:hypothetical protein